MNWADAHRIAMVAAAHAHADLMVDLTRSVDVFSIVRSADIVLGFQPFPRLSGAYLAEPCPGIVINANHPRSRQRYTAAHEFGHHLLGHGTSLDPDLESLFRRGATGIPDIEKVAEAFAAWFLMPRRLVSACLAGLGIGRPTSPHDVYNLSLRLGTSYEATAWHLPNLRLADRGQVHTWARVKPARIKRDLAGSWRPRSFRNDVWCIGPADDGAAIVLRPGDRLILRLPEIPSRGDVWLLREVPDGCDILTDEYLAPRAGQGSPEDDVKIASTPVEHLLVMGVSDGALAGRGALALLKAPGSDNRQPIDSLTLNVTIAPPFRGVHEPYFQRAA